MIAIEPPGGGWVDHIVWGVPDTEAGAERLADLTGIRAQAASTERPESYPTYSNGISLGGERFFEIYGPNPNYDGPPHPMHDLLQGLNEPRLLVWFTRVADLPGAGKALAEAGLALQPMLDEWERTDAASFRNGHVRDHIFDPSVPFLIEWRNRLDMDDRMAGGFELVQLSVVASDPERTAAIHRVLGIDVPIEAGDSDEFYVRLNSPKGEVTL